MKNIALLGSTGSVGESTLQVVRHLHNDLKIKTLAARSNLDLLEKQVREFQPDLVAVYDEAKAKEFKKRVPNATVVVGEEGLSQAAAFAGADFTMLAMSGNCGLMAAMAAIEAGKQIGLANKEILVCAGELIMAKAREKNVLILPVDSEHSAIFQCLHGKPSEVRRLILTASGGPFRNYSVKEMAKITVGQALVHPTYRMGKKISVDCSTLMNKGFEIIEARWLFNIAAIDVVIHPQSVVHSFVEYCDGSLLAQMSEPDMAGPIQYSLTYPNRRPSLLPPFDFAKNPPGPSKRPTAKNFPVCVWQRKL